MTTILQRSRRIPPSDKATWHQETGAGKSHVKRPFFGLAPDDEAFIETELGLAIDVNVQREDGKR